MKKKGPAGNDKKDMEDERARMLQFGDKQLKKRKKQISQRGWIERKEKIQMEMEMCMSRINRESF